MPVNKQVSRGDLLRWIVRFSVTEHNQQRLTAPILGYELPPQQPKLPLETSGQPKFELGEDKPPTTVVKQTEHHSPVFYKLSQCVQYASPESRDDPLGLQGIEPLQAEDLQPASTSEPLPWQHIVPIPRLSAFLNHRLAHSAGQQLDIVKLVKQVAYLKILLRLPRKDRIVPAGRMVVLLDLSRRLRPFWQDGHAVCELVSRKQGRNGFGHSCH